MFEVTIERKLQALIGGGCSVPLGINASVENGELTIHSALGTEEGDLIVKQHITGRIDDADRLIAQSLAGIRKAEARKGQGSRGKGKGRHKRLRTNAGPIGPRLRVSGYGVVYGSCNVTLDP